MAASIIDVVASGHINRAVVLDVTERLAIQTPRYWVAQATLAVAAWLDDNQQQHHEALDYALRSTSRRRPCSWRSCCVIRTATKPAGMAGRLPVPARRRCNLPRHFQVVIDAVTGNALGGGAAPRLVKQVGEWYSEEEAAARTSSTPRSASGSGGCSAWARGTGSIRISRCSPTNEQDDGRSCLPGMRPTGPSSRRPGISAGASSRARRCQMTSGPTSPMLLEKLARTEDLAEEELRGVISGNPGHHDGQGRPQRRAGDGRRRGRRTQEDAQHRGDGEPVGVPGTR